MSILADTRKRDVEVPVVLDNGMFKYKTDNNNIPYYYFLGEKAVYKKYTKRKLASSVEDILNIAGGIADSVPSPGGGPSLINVSGPDDVIFFGDTTYYSFSEEYIELSSTSADIPENKKEVKKTQVSSIGYTINGDVIIGGGSKGLITTISQVMGESDIPDQGDTDSDLGLITSVSRSNPRYINNKKCYDVNITYQEI